MDFVDIWTETERLCAEDAVDLARAAALLRDGGLVAFPTETVYGLGANAMSAAAVAKIFEAKRRPRWDPLIVHVCDEAMLRRVAQVSAAARRLMEAFWPGPLTLLLPRTAAISDAVTAGRLLVGVRMPRHASALALIAKAGVPIAAPSANLFGHTSPTTGAHVLADLDGRIDAVLEGGATEVGLESTVAGFMGEDVVIYRPGAVTLSMLEAVAGRGRVRMYIAEAGLSGGPESMPSPGLGLRHYAPRARLVLVDEQSMGTVIARLSAASEVVGLMAPHGWDVWGARLVYAWGPWKDGAVLARRLFAGLRELDDRGATVIVCPRPELDEAGSALRDRLDKAALGRSEQGREV